MLNVNSETDFKGPRTFQPTAWTQILSARDGSTESVKQVLDHLADLYWKPAYYHIRRKGYSIEDAKDLTQQFFMLFIERGALLTVDPAKGKFRTFILASLNNFLCDEYDRRNALKRRPEIDFAEADQGYYEQNTFDRDWATVILDRAFARLQKQAPREAKVVEAQRTGKTRYRELADELELSEANVKVLAHRGRSKLRAIILEELKETVSRAGEEKEELDALFRAFSV